MKSVASLMLLAVALLLLVAPVHAEGPGVISGQVVNGTTGGAAAGAAEVVLGAYRGDSLEREVQAQADEEGRFRFEGLEVAEGLTYQVGTTYADLLYRSELVRLTASQAEQQVTVKVYEPTPADPGLRASQVFVSLSVAKDSVQELLVTELIRLVNASDRTFVPQAGGPGGPTGLVRFGLPPGAKRLEPGWGLDPRQVFQVDRGFTSLAPVPPGESVFRFSYRVPFHSTAEVLEQSLPYGAELVRVMTEEGGPKVVSPALTFEQALDTKGPKILVWAARDLAPGTRLGIELADLPVPPAWTRLADAFASPWVIAALVALVPVLGVFWTLRGRARPLVPARSSDESSTEALVEPMAGLDKAFAAGRAPDPEYATAE